MHHPRNDRAVRAAGAVLLNEFGTLACLVTVADLPEAGLE
jgi:hypothetical protein